MNSKEAQIKKLRPFYIILTICFFGSLTVAYFARYTNTLFWIGIITWLISLIAFIILTIYKKFVLKISNDDEMKINYHKKIENLSKEELLKSIKYSKLTIVLIPIIAIPLALLLHLRLTLVLIPFAMSLGIFANYLKMCNDELAKRK